MRLKKGLLLSVLLVSALVVSVINATPTYAAQIGTGRSLTLQAGTAGGSSPSAGGNVKHKFDFTLPTTATAIGSIKLEYCMSASVTTCTPPTVNFPAGIVTTTATVSGGSGWASGATLVATTNGSPYLTKAAAAPGGTAISFVLNTVTNPTAANSTFFVRISTYVATTATGSPIDTGTVAASTATPIVLTGTMPESLIFCVGEQVLTTSGIPDCTTATAGAVTFNQLFSPTDTATARSQMAASTNAAQGYSITVNGVTMTSGSNTIPAMGSVGLGVRGTGQFGLNLKLNTTLTSTVAVGAEVAAAADGVNLKGQAATGYNTVDQFKFVTGDPVANSANGGAGPTNAQIFTASYIVNVAGNQASGTYTTTITYICTATF